MNRILEIFWLIVAILTAIMACYIWFQDGFKQARMFGLMTALSLLLYLARRRLRIKKSKE